MQYKKLILLIMLAPLAGSLHASHYMGGEISWECTSNGNFRFIVKLYRECAGIAFPNQINLTTNIPGFASIQTTRNSMKDISPACSCPGGPSITCAGTPFGQTNSNAGAMQMDIFTSDHAYPFGVPLTGVPPATGWYIGYSSCCRNPCHNIQNTFSQSWFLRAWIFPYNNTPVNTCYDNSPVFREAPSPVFCISHPVTIAQNVSDPDGDSLAFAWAQPLANNINTPLVSYFPGYSFNSPLPDIIHNPNNIPATLDAKTGLIRFTSYTNGAFVTVTKVSSYKNGIKVSEVYREIQVVLLDCGSNSPPAHIVTPLITELNTGEYLATVTAGDSLNLEFMITEYDTCMGTIQPHSISLRAFGEQFGQPVNSAGCATPPCATLSPSPTDTTPLIMQGVLTTTFSWQTTTDHLDHSIPVIRARRHTFYLHYQDNHCPVPASGSIILHVDVGLPYSAIPVDVLCVQATKGGAIHITWEPTTIPPAAFDRYEIMTSTHPQGPFTVAGQESNITATGFTHQPTGTPTQGRYYYINTKITQPMVFAIPSSRVTSMIVLQGNAGPNVPDKVFINWSKATPLSATGAPPLYEVYRDDGNGWQMIHHTHGLTFTDQLAFAGQSISYRIESSLTDPSGTIMVCRNISNTITLQLNSVPDIEPEIRLPNIYPNPSQGSFMLAPGSFRGDALMEITTLDGALVRRFSTTLSSSEEITISVEDLTPGIYLIRITTPTDQHTMKMVKE